MNRNWFYDTDNPLNYANIIYVKFVLYVLILEYVKKNFIQVLEWM